MNKQNDIVTNKDINKAAFRYMFMACNTFNYETQQRTRSGVWIK